MAPNFEGGSNRRDFFKTAGVAGLTTSLFTGQVKGANDRVAVGYIGLGAMGSGNLGYGMKVPEIQPAALCNMYEPYLERAPKRQARRGGLPPSNGPGFRRSLTTNGSTRCVFDPRPLARLHGWSERLQGGEGRVRREAGICPCTSGKARRWWRPRASPEPRGPGGYHSSVPGGYFLEKAEEIVTAG